MRHLSIESASYLNENMKLIKPKALGCDAKAQPEELAPSYVFLAASDSSFITGALLDVTGEMMSS